MCVPSPVCVCVFPYIHMYIIYIMLMICIYIHSYICIIYIYVCMYVCEASANLHFVVSRIATIRPREPPMHCPPPQRAYLRRRAAPGVSDSVSWLDDESLSFQLPKALLPHQPEPLLTPHTDTVNSASLVFVHLSRRQQTQQ